MTVEDKHAEMTELVTWMRANGVTKFAVDGMEITVDLYYPFGMNQKSWPWNTPVVYGPAL